MYYNDKVVLHQKEIMNNKLLDQLQQKIRKNSDLIDILDNQSVLTREELSEKTSELINGLSELCILSRKLPREYGFPLNEDGNQYPMEVKELTDNNSNLIGYHFKLPVVLDKRENNKNYNHTRELAKANFLNAFKGYEENTGFKHISQKVLIMYVNHFSDQRLMVDNDNIDTKAFTDFITTYILDDDNPSRCDLYIKGVLDTEDFTEVFVTLMGD